MGKKKALEERINETCEMMAALTAYNAGGDKETVIRRIKLVAGWSLENAECFYDTVERDGVPKWRDMMIESVEQLITNH